MNDFIFKKHKILFLNICENMDTYPHMRCASLYKDIKGWEKRKFKFAEHVSGSDMSKWYGEWKQYINEYDTVFIGDGGRGPDIVAYLNKVNPNIRVILYYLDTIFPGHRCEPCNYKDLNCEMYTFDKENAKKYGIPFKHFYYPYMSLNNASQLENVNASISDNDVNDIFFVGQDKDRLAYLLQLRENFIEMGLSCDFHIKRDPHSLYWPWNKKHTFKDGISYDDVISRIKGCRAILDIVQEGQHGLTWRPMEAMCFGKKLITNFTDIINYPFYNPENIFVLGTRKINELPSFVSTSPVKVDKSIRDEYVFENWLESFFIE